MKKYMLIDENYVFYKIEDIDGFLNALDEQLIIMFYGNLKYYYLYNKRILDEIKSGKLLADYDTSSDYGEFPFEEINNTIELLSEKISKNIMEKIDFEINNALFVHESLTKLSLN
jgi:hypothetical protein